MNGLQTYIPLGLELLQGNEIKIPGETGMLWIQVFNETVCLLTKKKPDHLIIWQTSIIILDQFLLCLWNFSKPSALNSIHPRENCDKF